MIEIQNKAKCCGCGACADICPKNAIQMQYDEKGFCYPMVDFDICVRCGLCDKVCSFQADHQEGTYIGKAYALQHKNKKILAESSSGGAFTAISDFVLSKGGKVYGACLDTETFEVKHVGTSDPLKRDTMRGSKYVQSSSVGVFKQVRKDLTEGTWVLFSGTPCQCAALRSYLGGEQDKLILVDLLCHGVPSNLLLKEHRTYWENKKRKKIVDYKYRSKKYGYMYTHEIIFEDGNKCSSLKLRQLLKLYSLTMRDSCYECPYASKLRYGDFTIGDFWEAAETVGIYDARGISVVLENTVRAEKVLKEIAKDCRIISVNPAEIKQNALSKPVQKTAKTDAFWADYQKKGYVYVLSKYAPLTLKSNIYQYVLRLFHLTKTDGLYAFVKNRIGILKEKKRK